MIQKLYGLERHTCIQRSTTNGKCTLFCMTLTHASIVVVVVHTQKIRKKILARKRESSKAMTSDGLRSGGSAPLQDGSSVWVRCKLVLHVFQELILVPTVVQHEFLEVPERC